ncbi:hypothetical protein KFU94_07655 [Chloroflexi bacterium TSY]|nr:hypothetical protein [Chloroflexi bacterium TSY]
MRSTGLDQDTADDVLSEIEAAERETAKDEPKAERILKRLKEAQSILTASAGVGAAAAAAADKLLPLLKNAIQLVGQIF